jgi:integrase
MGLLRLAQTAPGERARSVRFGRKASDTAGADGGGEQERQFAGDRWKETGYVFTSTIGTPIHWGNLLRDWYKIIKCAELPQIRFHDLRHSAATLLFAQGVHPKTVMEILGHSDLSTTMKIYGQVLDQMKRDAASKIDQIFGVATTSATIATAKAIVN